LVQQFNYCINSPQVTNSNIVNIVTVARENGLVQAQQSTGGVKLVLWAQTHMDAFVGAVMVH